MRIGSKVQVGERIGILRGYKKNKILVKFGVEQEWVSKSKVSPAKNRYTVGDISKMLEVTKPMVYYHLKKMKIKTKELRVKDAGNMHKQTIINGADALRLLANLHTPTDMVELRKVAKALKLHYVSVDYHLRKLKIKKFRQRLSNGHSAIVIAKSDANLLKEAIH